MIIDHNTAPQNVVALPFLTSIIEEGSFFCNIDFGEPQMIKTDISVTAWQITV